MTIQIRRRQGQRKDWPKRITAGSVTVTVYQVKARSNASGKGYVVAWNTPAGRKTQPFADPSAAVEEARIKVAQLATGRVEGAEMTQGDRDELQAARAMTRGRPLLSVLQEWGKAFDLTGGHVIDAATSWKQRHASAFKRILAGDAVTQFIAAKNKAGNEGERTYGSKLRLIKEYFKDRYLDEITTAEWVGYLEQWNDGVTRNDFRKRAVTLCTWAQSRGFLQRGIKTEIEQTERAKEKATEIGILSPAVYRQALKWIEANHPQHLAAVVVAGFCGVRSDEIHGKRGDRDKNGADCRRQTWEDINLTERHLTVSVAKTNTPAWRLVPVCDAAIRWLKVCPGEHKGPICEAGAMEKVRALLIEAKFDLPDNCFRHSFITYRVAVLQNKAQTAVEAGNSVGEIDRRYRRPMPQAAGKDWFASAPNVN